MKKLFLLFILMLSIVAYSQRAIGIVEYKTTQTLKQSTIKPQDSDIALVMSSNGAIKTLYNYEPNNTATDDGVNVLALTNFSGRWIILNPSYWIIGEYKFVQKTQSQMPTGWIQLDGRLKSTLTATQQVQATALGFGTTMTDATNAYISQNGQPLGSVTGSNNITIAQNQLPNISLDWSHRHTINTSFISPNRTWANTTGGTAGWTTAGVINTGLSGGVWKLNGGVTQQSLNIQPKTMSANLFIYLGN